MFRDVPAALENVYLWYARTVIPFGIVGVFLVVTIRCAAWWEDRKEKKLGWHAEPAAAKSGDPRQ